MTGKSERPPAGRKQSAPAPQSLPLSDLSFLFFIFGFSNSLCDSFYIYIFIFFYI